MPSEAFRMRHPPVYILLCILLLSELLVPWITFNYAYDAFSRLAAGLGFAALLAAFGATWLITRTTRQGEARTPLDEVTLLGLFLGLVWMIEIAFNNAVAPPLPARDIIDNVFWALIAIAIAVASAAAAYRSGRLSQGIAVGAWSGFVSGVVACGTGLALVVLGMPLLLSDPLNLAEWSNRAKDSTAPTMASYLAYETLAGAFLHLVVSGIGMGFVLGWIDGTLGKVAQRGRRGLRGKRFHPNNYL
jgi:cytochrome bd-type quinol oxidase subunit 2